MAIPATLDSGIVSDTSELSSTSFSIKTDAAMFSVFRKSIYSDIILAPIREISTNAIDACLEAGLPVKYDVHVPTIDESYFSVRDYGLGLSKEFIESDYTVVGASTKRESNVTNGQFGFGRLSPLAYTSSYTVESWNSGTHYTYLVSMVEGIPAAVKLAEEPSSEPSGTKVSFPVDPSDINSFVIKLTNLYMFFEQQPTTINTALKSPVIHLNTDTYMLTDTSSGVVMANVFYPLSLTTQYRGLVLKIPTGSVSLTPGREALNYDPATTAFLTKAITDAEADIIASANIDIAMQPTAYEAGRLYHTLYERTPHNYKHTLTLPTYQGFDCAKRVPISSSYFSVVAKHRYYRTLRTPYEICNNRDWFFTNPIYIGDVINLPEVIKASNITNAVIIKLATRSKKLIPQYLGETKKLLDGFGVPYTLLSSLDIELPKKENKPKVSNLILRPLNRINTTVTYEESMNPIYYIPSDYPISTYQLATLINHLKLPMAYSIATSSLPKIKNNENFIPLEDYIKELAQSRSCIMYTLPNDYSSELSRWTGRLHSVLYSDKNPLEDLRIAANYLRIGEELLRKSDLSGLASLIPIKQYEYNIKKYADVFKKYKALNEFHYADSNSLLHYLKLEHHYANSSHKTV